MVTGHQVKYKTIHSGENSLRFLRQFTFLSYSTQREASMDISLYVLVLNIEFIFVVKNHIMRSVISPKMWSVDPVFL